MKKTNNLKGESMRLAKLEDVNANKGEKMIKEIKDLLFQLNSQDFSNRHIKSLVKQFVS